MSTLGGDEATGDHMCWIAWGSGAGSVPEEHVVLPSSQTLQSEDPGAEINLSFTTHLLGETGHNF